MKYKFGVNKITKLMILKKDKKIHFLMFKVIFQVKQQNREHFREQQPVLIYCLPLKIGIRSNNVQFRT